MSKKSQKTWFIKVRGSYLPNSWQAWALYVPFTLFLLGVLQMAARSDGPISSVLYLVFPQFICAAVVMTWIASKTSK